MMDAAEKMIRPMQPLLALSTTRVRDESRLPVWTILLSMWLEDNG